MMNSPTFKKYILPGLVFQSLVIAGGYGTGRELAEFFLSFGTLGGLQGLLVSMAIWSLVCAASFEFARIYKAYEYRTFFKILLGRVWVLYELCYYIMLLMVLAVAASAAGNILKEMFEFNYYIGVIIMMLSVAALVFKGKDALEKALTYWSFLLYVVFFIFLMASLSSFGSSMISSIIYGNVEKGWSLGGFKYSIYNLGIVPAILFTARHFEKRVEAISAGVIAGIIGVFPGLMLYLAMVCNYPKVLDEAVPTNYILGVIGVRWLQIIFQIVLFGTLVETGAGYIFGFNERVASVYNERRETVPDFILSVVTIVLLFLGAFTARFGLIGLIAKGYGTIAWGFLFVYVIPILSLGIWKLGRIKN